MHNGTSWGESRKAFATLNSFKKIIGAPRGAVNAASQVEGARPAFLKRRPVADAAGASQHRLTLHSSVHELLSQSKFVISPVFTAAIDFSGRGGAR